MAQSNFNIGNVSRTLIRAHINESNQALATLSSGATEPSTTYPYQFWADTTSGLLKQRNGANSAWIIKGALSDENWGFVKSSENNTFTGVITMDGKSLIQAKGANVASASTADIWANDGDTLHITGTTNITSLGSAPQAGAWKKVIFDGTLTLTQSTNLNLNGGGGNITVAAGDIAFVFADTASQLDVYVIKKSGQPIIVPDTGFPAGTRMLFQQTSAPTGWTKVTDAAFDDSILRIVTGTVGNGGSQAFSTWNSLTTTGAHTLTTAQIPAHSHGGVITTNNTTTNGQVGAAKVSHSFSTIGFRQGSTANAGNGGSHTHPLSNNVRYRDTIIAVKD